MRWQRWTDIDPETGKRKSNSYCGPDNAHDYDGGQKMRKVKLDYRFIEKDPVIDLIRTAYLDSNMRAPEVAERARIAPQTFDNWLYGITKRPQHRTVTAVLDVFGVDIQYVYRSNGQTLTARPGVSRKFTTKPKGRQRRLQDEKRLALVASNV